MKTIKIGAVSIPLDSYIIGGTAILGIRDSGKTYGAKGIVEQLLEHDIPLVIFDAIGVWRYLKAPGQMANARGYQVVVAGGNEPDLPLNPQSAAEIVRAAIRENITVIFDLYDRKLSKTDWRRIVQACFRTLLFENEGLRHIILEESAEFIPQKVMDGETYAEVEKVVRMGGNRSLGVTLINQRSQEVNKAVLDLCENLVLMKQRGAHAIDSLERWMDRLSPDQAKAIARSLPSLSAGECWVFPGSADAPTRTKTQLIRSFHPDRRKPQLTAKAKSSIVDTSQFIVRMNDALPRIAEESKANDPAELKKRIRELERQLAAKPAASIDEGGIRKREQDAREAAHAAGFNAGANHGYRRGWDEHAKAMGAAIANIPAAPPSLGDVATTISHRTPTTPPPAPRTQVSGSPRVSAAPARIAPHTSRTVSHSTLSAAARKILSVLSQFPDGCKANKLTLLTGYKYSGSFQNALSELRTSGLLTGANTDAMQITSAGLEYGPFQELPSGRALGEYWLQHPSFGKAARDILRNLLDTSGGMTAEELCEATGYSYSGSFQNALSELRTAGVLVGRNTERMRASEDLF